MAKKKKVNVEKGKLKRVFRGPKPKKMTALEEKTLPLSMEYADKGLMLLEKFGKGKITEKEMYKKKEKLVEEYRKKAKKIKEDMEKKTKK